MPVEPHRFDPVVIVRRIAASESLGQYAAQIHDAGEDVAAVKAGQDEERGAELRRAPFVLSQAEPLVNEMRPLVRLHAEEADSAENGEQKPVAEALHVPVLHRGQRLDHRNAAADEEEGHEDEDYASEYSEDDEQNRDDTEDDEDVIIYGSDDETITTDPRVLAEIDNILNVFQGIENHFKFLDKIGEGVVSPEVHFMTANIFYRNI